MCSGCVVKVGTNDRIQSSRDRVSSCCLIFGNVGGTMLGLGLGCSDVARNMRLDTKNASVSRDAHGIASTT